VAERVESSGVWAASGFFALCALLEIGAAALAPSPGFWDLWDASGRSLLYVFVAAGLFRRIWFFRLLAAVYCVVILLTYAAVIVLAYSRTRAVFPTSLIVRSLFEIPSAALLLPYLRSSGASATFSRSFFRS
jgi:hypothetical protein